MLAVVAVMKLHWQCFERCCELVIVGAVAVGPFGEKKSAGIKGLNLVEEMKVIVDYERDCFLFLE